MTKEEQTISNLKKLKSFHNGSYGADIDRAIKALEQEQKTNNGVKTELNGIKTELEQEPKTGHWIQTNEFFINQDGQFIYKFICSECKSLSYFRKSNKKAIGANVCPNCGCRMVEPQENDHKCHTCKHYTSGENDGSCGSYICKEYSNWESEE